MIMTNNKNFKTNITTHVSPHEAFVAICNVNKWWAIHFAGTTEKLQDSFTVRFGETYGIFEVTELVPDKKIVWHTKDSYLHWAKDKGEWINTKIVFEISEQDNATIIDMTHIGLVPKMNVMKNVIWVGIFS